MARSENGDVRHVLRRWFDPSEAGTVGTTPDYRFSLANERTFLAWIRTSLALVGGALAVATFLPPRWAVVREAIALCLLVLGAALALRAVNHWAQAERAMRLGEPLPPSRFPALLGLSIGVGAVVLLAVLTWTAVRP